MAWPSSPRYILPRPMFLFGVAILAAALLVLDLTLPLGTSAALLYVALVLLSAFSRERRDTIALAGLATVLIALAFLVKTETVAPLWAVGINRMIAGFLCWTMAGVILLARGGESADGPAIAAMPRRSRLAVLAILTLGFAIALTANLIGARLAIMQEVQARDIAARFALQRDLGELRRLVREAGGAQQDYLLTGEEEFAEAFAAHRELVDDLSAELGAQADPSAPASSTSEAARLAREQVAAMAGALEAPNAVWTLDTIDQAPGSDYTRLREALNQASEDQQSALAASLRRQSWQRGDLLAIQVSGSILLLIVASASLVIVWRESERLARAHGGLAEANAALESRVSERTNDLARAGEELAAQSEQTRLALEAGEVGTWSLTLSGRGLFCDRKCRHVYGLDETGALTLRDLAGRVHEEDRARLRDGLRAAMDPNGEGRLDVEHRLSRPDGTASWVVMRGQCYFREANGRRRPARLAGTLVDITERKQAEESQTLLLRELSHRVKNILAVVQSMLALSARAHPEARAFVDAFKGRLAALSIAHTLLIGSQRQFADLESLTQDTLQPFMDDEGLQRLVIEAERVVLRPAEAQTIALLLHELATNAAKHGALSRDGGRVRLTGRTTREAGEDGETNIVLVLEWSESGGPPAVPTRRGFGMTLLERAVHLQHGGTTDLDWRESGLAATIRIPLDTSLDPRPSEKRTTARESEMSAAGS